MRAVSCGWIFLRAPEANMFFGSCYTVTREKSFRGAVPNDKKHERGRTNGDAVVNEGSRVKRHREWNP